MIILLFYIYIYLYIYKSYSRRHLPNNYLRHAPPSKRIRLEEPTDEKSNENKSDMSQDESDMSQDES